MTKKQYEWKQDIFHNASYQETQYKNTFEHASPTIGHAKKKHWYKKVRYRPCRTVFSIMLHIKKHNLKTHIWTCEPNYRAWKKNIDIRGWDTSHAERHDMTMKVRHKKIKIISLCKSKLRNSMSYFEQIFPSRI